MATIHQQRVAEHIRTFLSELFIREMRDPRLSGVTVTEVEVDRELQFADIYVHALGEDEREEEIMVALTGASGYLRRELGSGMRVRTMPMLRFHWDPSFAYAEHIDELLAGLDIPADTHENETDEL